MTSLIAQRRNVRKVREAVSELNLDPIKVKVMDQREGLGWTRQHADEIEVLYRDFLFLAWKYRDRVLTPPSDVDKFWHFHILDTEKYAQDCEKVFGYFLHHFPYFGMRGEEDAAKLAASAGETKALFEQEFGSLLPELMVNTCSGSWCSSTFSELSQAAREELRVDWRPSLAPTP